MARTIRIQATFPTTPEEVYASWLDGTKHAAMTGSPATSEARKGGRFTAWDGYIMGHHLELSPPERIVQAWRTTEFRKNDPDSRLQVKLSVAAGGTRMTLVHSDLPEGTEKEYRRGWKEFYVEPMRRHFAEARDAKSEPAPRTRK